MTTGTPGVVLDKVVFSYGETAMHFDVAAAAGAITAIMGPSGSGKSTLLHLIAGFETPASGRVLIGSSDVTILRPADRPMSMIFQENNLFGHLDVAENVGLGRSPGLRLTEADRADIAVALARTGLSGKENRLPRELSGGERQRVAIARALVRRRAVLLLDEPFAALGPALRDDMLDLVADLQAETAMTVVLVTHQPEDARRIARDLIFVENGSITAAGPTAEILQRQWFRCVRILYWGNRYSCKNACNRLEADIIFGNRRLLAKTSGTGRHARASLGKAGWQPDPADERKKFCLPVFKQRKRVVRTGLGTRVSGRRWRSLCPFPPARA